jgi:peptide chain release factor 2
VWTNCGGSFDIDRKRDEIAEREMMSQAPNFWDDQTRAQAVMQEIATRKDWVGTWEAATQAVDDVQALIELADEAEDESMEAEIVAELNRCVAAVDELELRKILSGPDDDRNAILTINAGAGGTEAQDWAEMLLRMYTRWAEKKGFQVFLADEQEGDTAGIKSGTLEIKGKYAYGYLKAENGVHRLVRISPYDSNARRHTSFASVFVYPEVEDDVEIEVNPADVEVRGQGWTEREQGRNGRASASHSLRHRRCLSAGTLAADEPRARHEDAQEPPVPEAPGRRRSCKGRYRRYKEENRVGLADPVLRFPAVHHGE